MFYTDSKWASEDIETQRKNIKANSFRRPRSSKENNKNAANIFTEEIKEVGL